METLRSGAPQHWSSHPDEEACRALLVDLDGVLRTWDPIVNTDAERRSGLPVGSVLACAFEPSLLSAAITGAITDHQWRMSVADRLSRTYGPGARAAVQAWTSSSGRINATVLSMIRNQRRQRRVALITNATTRLPDDLARHDLTSEFDLVVNSAEVGAAKPDPRIFHAAVDRLGLAATQCALIDDTEANVQAGRAVGLRAHLFRNPMSLNAFLLGLSDTAGGTNGHT